MNKHHRRPDGIDPVARSRSRRRALQAIYAWQINHADERALIAQFAHEQAHVVPVFGQRERSELFEKPAEVVDAWHGRVN